MTFSVKKSTIVFIYLTRCVLMVQKIRVAVLYGGRSSEHEVSINSASNVIRHLDRTQFDVVPIGIDKQGRWFLGDDIVKKELSSESVTLLEDNTRLVFNPDYIGKSISALHGQFITDLQLNQRLFDVVFPVIHGPLCEDGTVQGLLELAEVPYVGCGVLSSAIGMDKDVSKRLIAHSGISVPAFQVIKKSIFEINPHHALDSILQALTFPLFVKPVNTGSSVGIRKVKIQAELLPAIEYAFQYDTKVIIEQGINNIMEIELAVLESREAGAAPIVSIPGEICPSHQHEFYSYASKYLDDQGAALIIPAPLSEKLQATLCHSAKQIFTTLECEGMARVDLFLERDTHKIYFNEINTIPGFTKISMYPKLMEASGMPYKELLTHLVMLALDRQTRKKELIREYS